MAISASARAAMVLLQQILQPADTKKGPSPLAITLLSVLIAILLIFAVIAYVIVAPTALAGDLGRLQQEVYQELGYQETRTLSDEDIALLAASASSNPARQSIIAAALSLVGRVPYFWGGKPSGPGWDDQWRTLQLVTAPGVSSSDTYQPYGLDCGGFTDWAFWTAGFGRVLQGGVHAQWWASEEIDVGDLLPGDLAFLSPPDDRIINHVGIYYGKDGDGQNLYIHCSASAGGVVVNGFDGFAYFRRPPILNQGGEP